jgi:EAL domain-containing protein (putative c-di-GMP-specific phosphodiesterase class I)
MPRSVHYDEQIRHLSFLEIDRSFIENLCAGSEDQVIVDAVRTLGHSFGPKVIGEGASSDVSRTIAVELGCDPLQGVHLGGPMDPARLENAIQG